MAHRLLAVLISLSVFGLTLALASCGSDSSNSSNQENSPSTTTSSAAAGNSQLCDTLTSLSADVKAMANAGSVSQFQSEFNAAKKDFADLKPAASAAYGNDVDAVQKALDEFGTALQNAGQGGAGSTLQALGTAAANLGQAVQKLATDLPCPSSTSS